MGCVEVSVFTYATGQGRDGARGECGQSEGKDGPTVQSTGFKVIGDLYTVEQDHFRHCIACHVINPTLPMRT